MNKKLSIFISGTAILSLLAGCAAKQPTSSSNIASSSPSNTTITVDHLLGEAVIPINPKNVVVFDYGTLDTLDALDVTANIAVPKTDMPIYLDKYNGEDFFDVGGVKEFDIETVNEFNPDLIIISTRQQDFYEELSTIAPTLYVDIDSNHYMQDFEKNVLTLGEIFNKTEQAKESLANIEKQVTTVQKLATEKNEKGLIILTNDGSISAYGSGSRFGIIHDTFGIPMADSGIEATRHGVEINYEYIAEKNPDILFVVDRTVIVGGTVTATQTLDNPLVNGVNAVKNNRIITLDPDIWYLSGGGLQSVEKMTNDMLAVVNA